MIRTWKMWMMVLAAAMLPLALGLPNAESRTDAVKAHTAKKPRYGTSCRNPIYVSMSNGTGFGRQRLIDTEMIYGTNTMQAQITVAKRVAFCKSGYTDRDFSTRVKRHRIFSRVRIWRDSTRSYVMSYRFLPTGTPGVYRTKVFKYWSPDKYSVYAEAIGRFRRR